jgi:uncharacterized protein YgiM (DUF1202 family)
MGKVYYNQADPRWANHPYPSQELPNATIKSGGCGVTCAAMVISSSKEIIYPDEMGDIAIENGFRPNGGTSFDLFPYIAQRWVLEIRDVKSSYEALDACREGYFVVILVGAGLWTTGGHYILAVGSRGDEIEIYDPYLYAGKFDRYGRQGKVSVEGNSCFVNINTFKKYSEAHAFFAFKINDEDIPDPEPQDPILKYVNTNSLNLNVRSAPGGTIIGSLPKGTQVLVYEEIDGWSRIGNNKWVSSAYLATYDQKGTNTMHVVNVSSRLNVRSGPSTDYNIVGHLYPDNEVESDGQEGNWYHIVSPIEGWVSGDYLEYGENISYDRGTVGQLRRFDGHTIIYQNPDLTGKTYNYLPQTQVKILENVSANIDKIYVIKTGRVGYVSIDVY